MSPARHPASRAALGSLLLILALTMAEAASPPAGTEITNQAAISYVDAQGRAADTLTNAVILTVNAVYAATIEADRVLEAAPAQLRSFRHRLVNTGNADDVFRVAVAQDSDRGPDSGDFSFVRVYRDSNGNGVVDAGEPLLADATGSSADIALAAGGLADLIVQAQLPGAAAENAVYDLTLTAQAYRGGSVPVTGSVTDLGAAKGADGSDDTNEDRVTVTFDAVLQVTKSAVYEDQGTASVDDDTILYSVSVRNFGQNVARDILVTDTLPANTSFNLAYGVQSTDEPAWNAPNAGDDGANGAPGALPSHAAGTLSGEIDNLATGASADFSYRVDLADGLAGGAELRNTASADGDLDLNAATDEDAVESNQTVSTVPAVYGVVLSDTGANPGNGVNDGGDDDNTINDRALVDAVDAGASVRWTQTVTHTGTVTDNFNLSVAACTPSPFPDGTVFRYYAADGHSPLTDSTGDGVPDTGPLAPGDSRTVVLRAMLPPDGDIAGDADCATTATSSADPSATPASDPSTVRLGAINDPAVDIANSIGATGFDDDGSVDADPVAAVTTTLAARTGATVSFPLHLANEGTLSDNYNLASAGSADFATPVPDGWQVLFEDGSGAEIVRTPTLDPGATFAFRAVVRIPEGAPPASTVSLFFRARSEVTGAADTKQDALSFDFESIRLVADQAGSVQACGSTTYTHLLANDGDTAEAVRLEVTAQSLLTHQLLLPTGFAGGEFTGFRRQLALSVGESVAIRDASADAFALVALVSDGAGGVAVPLDVDDETRVQVKVMAPCGAGQDTTDVLELQASVVVGTATQRNTDRSTVGDTLLTISKRGALDAGCDGTPDFGFQTANVSAAPDQCVIWQLSLANQGGAVVCEVTANDAAPPFTSLDGSPSVFSQPLPGAGSCTVSGAAISCTVGNSIDRDGDGTPETHCLRGGEAAEVRFGVRLQAN